MKDNMIRCMRCLGRKKLYKVNSVYSLENTGGTIVNCPLCLGEGMIKTVKDAIQDAKKLLIKSEVEKLQQKENEMINPKDGKDARKAKVKTDKT